MIAKTIGTFAVELVISTGVGTVIGNAIKATTPAQTSILNKVAVGVGTLALSTFIGDRTTKFMLNHIEETAEQFKALF